MGDREIYEYDSGWTIYSMNWSNRPEARLALGSFKEDFGNVIKVIDLRQDTGEFVERAQVDHPYPPTKLMWHPSPSLSSSSDLLCSSADYLRLWEVSDVGITLKHQFSNLTEYAAPLTSFDWNETDPKILGTSSIDTTCTIWNIETRQAVTQLIAHDTEVYDMTFGRGTDLFASVGADGSLRTFDLRSLRHSTIVYETPKKTPLLRVSWNRQDEFYLATFGVDSPSAIILDTRYPTVPVTQLSGHEASPINAISWAPHSSCHISTAGEDKQVLIWDLRSLPSPVTQPSLAYYAPYEINQLQLSRSNPSLIAIAFSHRLQLLRL
eukprot:TRINITY_DN11974_c0_g1_i1.p1 TRINITY_DN11974_c0_g1~~TRINITY_DN11974_c0_g1_i1.p1  ORF type:complete len:374 (+),score=97.42 TRINITY_DN11974_c0_g1_i1:156-1124(+)